MRFTEINIRGNPRERKQYFHVTRSSHFGRMTIQTKGNDTQLHDIWAVVKTLSRKRWKHNRSVTQNSHTAVWCLSGKDFFKLAYDLAENNYNLPTLNNEKKPALKHFYHQSMSIYTQLWVWNAEFTSLAKAAAFSIGKHFLASNQIDAFFMYLFISSLYMFRASQCSSSGDRIVLIHHLVRLVLWLHGMPVRRELCSLLTGIPSSYLHRLIIPDDVLI